MVGRIVADCVEHDITLQELTVDELKSYSELFGPEALDAIDIDNVVRRRTTYGGTGHDAVAVQLKEARAALKNATK